MATRDRGSAGPACLFASLPLLVLATVFLFSLHSFQPPPAITSAGEQVDGQHKLTLYVTGAAFILAQLGLGFASFRYRDRGQRARFTHGSRAIEIAVTAAAVVLFLGLGFLGRKAWAEVGITASAPDAIQVEVTESQFVFHFRYAGPDGKFGRIDPARIRPSAGNPLGIDENDPAGRDDIVVPVLTVPVNREVELLIRSQDVIHNFYVRELRLQQDAVPGIISPLRFTANRTGQYEIVCTQLCGLGHHRMHSFLNVVSESEYEVFLKQKAANQ